MNWRQIAIGVLILALIAVGIWWAFRPQPIGVDLATISRGTLIVTVDDEGLVQVRDTYQVSTPIGGAVQRIPLSVGDLVSKDQVVATIVPQLSGLLDERSAAEAQAAARAAQAAVIAAQTAVTSAEAELAFWRAEVDRTEKLLERGLATDQTASQNQLQLSQREAQLANARATLDMREQQLKQAEAQLLEPNGSAQHTISYEVRAPADGQVLELDNESARSLAAGSPLMTIGDPRDLEVIVDVLSTDAVKVVAGAHATIDGWGGDSILEAQVRRIEPIGFTKVSALGIEEQRVRVHLDILSDPALWRSLGHHYRVFVRIEIEKVENAIRVPTAALFRNNGDWAVFTFEDGIARLRHVTLGARDSGLAEVREGLDEGARVILHPNDRIADGGLIEDRATSAS